MAFMPNPRRSKTKPSTKNLIRTLSKMGLCSRTQALALVQAGRVTVNGRCVTEPGYVVQKNDRIQLNGQIVRAQSRVYFLFHKPVGRVPAGSDGHGRESTEDVLKTLPERVRPVGQLDPEAEGLLLLTDDKDLAARMTEPKFQVKRTYEVWVDGALDIEDMKKISAGVDLGRRERSHPARFKILSSSAQTSHGEIRLAEGKHPEVRRLFQVLGKPVKRLLCTAFGPFALGNLPAGEIKEIFKDPQGYF